MVNFESISTFNGLFKTCNDSAHFSSLTLGPNITVEQVQLISVTGFMGINSLADSHYNEIFVE